MGLMIFLRIWNRPFFIDEVPPFWSEEDVPLLSAGLDVDWVLDASALSSCVFAPGWLPEGSA